MSKSCEKWIGRTGGLNSSFQVQSITASLRAHPLSRYLSNSYSRLHDPLFQCSLQNYYFCPSFAKQILYTYKYWAIQMTITVRLRPRTMKWAPTVVSLTRFLWVLQNYLHIYSRSRFVLPISLNLDRKFLSVIASLSKKIFTPVLCRLWGGGCWEGPQNFGCWGPKE